MPCSADKAIRAVVFDLDGVIVSTDHFHFLAWKELADTLGLPFDEVRNHALRGVSRMESLETLLGERTAAFSPSEKASLAETKNTRYRELLQGLTPDHILPGVKHYLDACSAAGLRVAIASSSRNARFILERIGLDARFDAVVDGNDIARSKPDPEVFLKAADALGLSPEACLVVEDAEAGVTAALAANMPCLAVGAAADDPRATFRAPNLAKATLPGGWHVAMHPVGPGNTTENYTFLLDPDDE
jgi:beta-phosphoglucomutase